MQKIHEISDGKHVMLLCEDEEQRAQAAAEWINYALEEGHHCIYSSVYAFNQFHQSSISRISTKIKNYQHHLDNNNLQIIDFEPYYQSALTGNLTLFKNLKKNLEKISCENKVRGDKLKMTVFADAACCLCENKSYEDSEKLEKWWQDTHDEWVKNHYHITVICPHPQVILETNQNTRLKIANAHDIMISLNTNDKDNMMCPLVEEHVFRILIAESDPDLAVLYAEFLSRCHVNVTIVVDANECLSALKSNNFDVIILDEHLYGNILTKDLANEILRVKPDQRIALTTTNPSYGISTGTDVVGLNPKDILLKPFMLSNLLEVIKRK
jgi:CheY-like chemotaxis protein